MIGVTDAEREATQPLAVSLAINFAMPPKGEATDKIEDTICYEHLCEVIRETTLARPYRLIENLASEIYTAVREELQSGDKLTLSVSKLHPPIVGLSGGATYEIRDA